LLLRAAAASTRAMRSTSGCSETGMLFPPLLPN
jgi:hypothetical protein